MNPNDTYIKVYDWMSPIQPTERLVYALIYQLTVSADGFWSTLGVMSDRLGIRKGSCRRALDHLREIGAITLTAQVILHRERQVYTADLNFADKLRNE